MKAVFVFDTDKDEFGEAVAMITTKDYATFFARGVVRPLPNKLKETNEDANGWNALYEWITGEEDGTEMDNNTET